ncbi:HNH endonuclease signature motif containing protein [Chelatococcus sp.]|uniref:HNH endonuclease signature motif containing protein n=1 Tax=Chelatococcus sp. TaxID=1953771 RepID=UPI00344F4687
MAGMTFRTCERCGLSYSRPDRISNAQWASRRFCSHRCASFKRSVRDEDILEMYWSGMSCTEIAVKLSLAQPTISRIIRSLGATRSPSERLKLSHKREDVREKLSRASKGRRCSDSTKAILRARIGASNHNWRSGLTMTGGYIAFTASPANGAHAGRFLHAVIAEWKVGRSLGEGEVVHHIDGNKRNNHPDNLQVMLSSDHARLHAISNKLGSKKCQAA